MDRTIEDDEIVRDETYFHMERMSKDHIWFTVNDEAFDLYAVGGRLIWTPQRPIGGWGIKEIESI